ncbi:MAG: calcium-binding protein [Cyanobacteria bacterium J06623_7]
MSSVVVSFDSGTQLAGDNLSVIAQQGEANIIKVLADGEQSGASVSIVGGGLNDKIHLGVAGGSSVLGLGGNDTIIGGAKNDLLDGGEGHDFLEGAKGNDIISGGLGDDEIFGNEGNDIITAGAGDDIVSGGLGNDLISGGTGDDTIFGGPGLDTIKGGAGSDELVGGLGADVFEFNAGEFTSESMDTITDFADVDKITISGVGDGISYDPHTGIVSVDGVDAIDIGEGKDVHLTEVSDGEWEIF